MTDPKRSLHWSDPAADIAGDVNKMVAQIYKTRLQPYTWETNWWNPEPVMSLYDHEVFKKKEWVYRRSLGAKPEVRPEQHYCSCGWKNSGYDSETRARAHIAKLRAWLDEHPEEEVMAGFGGKIAWPPKPTKHKNKSWNKKKR